MTYKRPEQNTRRYFSPFYSPNPPYSMNSSSSGQKNFYGIPLPNEIENEPGHYSERKKVSPFFGVIDYIRAHVKIEEIILIGLIILMLDESIEDDLLMIILIYILLF
ncbi:MAG: hypothetical protein Q8924_16450 [Bacillota bacterium]|nr:hypothetical protein [Bacillota bacterium]